MLKGQQAYTIIKPITFIPWLVAQDEIFLPITEKEVPGVYPYYMVSNYGRIHNIYSITPFMYMLGAFNILMYNFCRQETITLPPILQAKS